MVRITHVVASFLVAPLLVALIGFWVVAPRLVDGPVRPLSPVPTVTQSRTEPAAQGKFTSLADVRTSNLMLQPQSVADSGETTYVLTGEIQRYGVGIVTLSSVECAVGYCTLSKPIILYPDAPTRLTLGSKRVTMTVDPELLAGGSTTMEFRTNDDRSLQLIVPAGI